MKNQSSSVIIVWTLLIAVLAGISSAFFYQSFTGRHSRHTLPSLPYLGEVGPFDLKSSDDQAVNQTYFKGNIWVADFIFTRCQGQCPFMTQKMKELEASFQSENLKFVSISVDPKTDIPEKLKIYKQEHEIQSDRWMFLTGDKQSVYDLVIKKFKLGVDENGGQAEPIIHSNRFVLIDGQGMIRGYYSAASQEDFQALKAALESLLKNPAGK